MPEPRFRVEFYTERHDGTIEWCVCDFGREAETGLSPKVLFDGRCQWNMACPQTSTARDPSHERRD